MEGLYITQIVKTAHTVTLWNDEYHVFDYQLDQWGVENLFQNSDEAITRELKFYIEDWEKLHIKSKSQVSKAMFIAKYGSLDLYDEDLKNKLSLTTNNYDLIKLIGGL